MTAKPTISLTDQTHEFAKSLVAEGRFASLSAVIQHGLRLVEQEEAERKARLEAIRGDLERRAGQPSVSVEDMDRMIATWRTRRDDVAADDLA